MGSAHSSHSSVSTAADEDGDDEDPSASSSSARPLPPAPQLPPVRTPPASASKVLEQEPEVLPCLAADSPLSPQPSAAGTPRLLAGHGIKVWDPFHVLLPPPPSSPTPHPHQQQQPAVEVVVVSHGECAAAMRPDLVGGRWPAAALTARGERQARALAVFLRSRGARLAAAYASPLDRTRATAALVCRELDFPEKQIQLSALIEMSPRQVQFRMMEFLNRTVLRLPVKVAMGDTLAQQNELKGFSRESFTNSVQDGPPWDVLYRLNQHSLRRKKSGKSRLQFVTSGDNETEDD